MDSRELNGLCRGGSGLWPYRDHGKTSYVVYPPSTPPTPPHRTHTDTPTLTADLPLLFAYAG